MAKKELLFQLICSLTKSEKRYFKLFVNKEKGHFNYLKLFDAIAAQTEYDEAALRKQFEGETFIRQMHVTKNYLRKLILKSLRNFHTNLSKDAALKEALRNVEILYHKELYSHALEELKRAKKLASRYELLTGLAEAAHWERKLEQAVRPHAYPTFKEALRHEKEALNLLYNRHEFWLEAVQTSELLLAGKPLPPPATALQHPENAHTLEAKTLFYNSLYLRHLNAGESEKAEQALRTLLRLMEADKVRQKEEPGLYVSTLNNLVSFLVFNKAYKEALRLIQSAKDLYEDWRITSENRTLLKQIMRTYNIELEIYRDTRSFAEHASFIAATERFLKINEQKLPKIYLSSFWFQLASIHFMAKNYSASLQSINRFLNARFKIDDPNLQVQARMLNLMIHLEQKNLMVLRYHVDSTRRFVKKVKDMQEFEKILLRFFRKIGRLPLLEYKAAFLLLREQLYPENAPPLVPDLATGYINYKAWLDQKLQGKW